MGHVSPTALWTYGCRVHALSDVELEHVLGCFECDRLLDEIEEALSEEHSGWRSRLRGHCDHLKRGGDFLHEALPATRPAHFSRAAV